MNLKNSQITDNDALWRNITLAAQRLGDCVMSNGKINIRCNICGDSKSNSRKKRGYLVYDKKRNLIYYKCFNEGDCPCAGEGNAWSGKKWLKHTAPDIYRNFRSETIVSSKQSKVNLTEASKSGPKKEEKTEDLFLPISKCSPDYFSAVKEFCLRRMIPREYIRTFKVAETGKYKGRLIIPFSDNHGNTYFQARTLFNQTPKYLNFVGNRDHAIFGIANISKDSPVVVLEGPIDSMFIENAVATLGCSYTETVQNTLNQFDSYYLFDNDTAGYSAAKRMLEEGKPVFLWKRFLHDNRLKESVKDINDLAILTKHKEKFKFEELRKWFSSSRFDEIWLR